MKIKIFIVIPFSLLVVIGGVMPCLGKEKLNKNISCLNTSYLDFYKATSKAMKRSAASRYLKCFPDSFKEFESFLGFNKKTGKQAPLYGHSYKYVGFLWKNYSYFNKSDYIKKFVAIGVTAHSVELGDIEGQLIGVTLIPFNKIPGESLKALSRYPDAKIRNFWHFTLSTLTGVGLDPTMYSCPMEFSGYKACKILVDMKKNARPYKSPC